MPDYARMLEDLYASNPKLGNMMLGAYNRGGLTGLLGQYNMGTGAKWQPKPKPAQAPVDQAAPAAMSRPTYSPTMYQQPTFNPYATNNMASFLAAGQAPQQQMPFVNPAAMYRGYDIGSVPQYQMPSGALRQPNYSNLPTKPMMGY